MDFLSIIYFVYVFIAFYFLAIYILLYIQNRGRLYQVIEPEREYSLSIVVPCYNEANSIGRNIESLLASDYKGLKKIIVVAGATGNLGQRIAKALLAEGAEVRCLVRTESNPTHIDDLKNLGATIKVLSDWTEAAISEACRGATCVVSVLAGLRDVVIDAQTVLLDGAIKVGVPRFIPSDYSLDFTRFTPGENRNLDWRREFHRIYAARAPSSQAR